MAQIAELLGQHGIWVNQVTTLDPVPLSKDTRAGASAVGARISAAPASGSGGRHDLGLAGSILFRNAVDDKLAAARCLSHTQPGIVVPRGMVGRAASQYSSTRIFCLPDAGHPGHFAKCVVRADRGAANCRVAGDA